MFTGLIEGVGHVAGITPAGTSLRLVIRTPLAPELQPGESVAVNGVCLTVTELGAGTMHADVGPETARVTTLGALREGQALNLERAARVDGRFGGHFVQGHVDAVGTLLDLRADGDARWLSIRFPQELARYFVRKGSVAVDGISLTIAELRDDHFEVMIIPFTWTHTNLRSLGAGAPVNLECDMVGKYVVRAVAGYVPQQAP